jgi:hypothetical protein
VATAVLDHLERHGAAPAAPPTARTAGSDAER